MARFLSKPVPHEEAARFIAHKPVAVREVFDRMLPEIRMRAFTITGVESAAVLQAVRNRIAELPRGGDWDEIKRDVADGISPWIADPSDKEGADRAMRQCMRRAEVLLRHHGFQAYQATQYEVLQEVVADFPYWKYQTVGDERVRDSHAALDGLVLPANHPFWTRHYPPWDWGCRCQVVAVSHWDYERIQRGEAQGRTLSPAQERLLMERGELDDGAGHFVNVQAPVERETTEEGKRKAYQWHPGELRLPVEDIRARYDERTWGAFEHWAKRTEVEDVSLWDWLHGEPILRASVLGRAHPLSRVAVVDAGKPLTRTAKRALEEMDKVVDGVPGPLEIGFTKQGAYGRYRDGRIWVREDGPWPRMTLGHEVGHHVYEKALKTADLSELMRAIDESQAVKDLALSSLSAEKKARMLSKPEKFARAYAQYMGERIDSQAWKEDITNMSMSNEWFRVWGKSDFASISSAMESALKKAGLL